MTAEDKLTEQDPQKCFNHGRKSGNLMFEKILVAVDGSKYSDAAFDVGMDIAQKYGSQVLVLHVYQVQTGSGATVTPSPNDDLEHAGQHILDSYEARIKERHVQNVKTLLMRGDAALRIIETASVEKYGLIVMGSRGIGGLKELLLGSVSRKVAQHADRPVLIVR